jgi:hypothetical protein
VLLGLCHLVETVHRASTNAKRSDAKRPRLTTGVTAACMFKAAAAVAVQQQRSCCSARLLVVCCCCLLLVFVTFSACHVYHELASERYRCATPAQRAVCTAMPDMLCCCCAALIMYLCCVILLSQVYAEAIASERCSIYSTSTACCLHCRA